MKRVKCPYCDVNARLVKGDKVYPYRPDLVRLWFWMCMLCRAYVGCHRKSSGRGNGKTPLGTLANYKTRKARQKAHEKFDVLWKKGEFRERNDAYQYLSEEMGMTRKECHISHFDAQQCNTVVQICGKYEHNRLD